MEKKKRFSLLKILITIICIVFIIISLLINITFSGGKTPHFFGRYIYIVNEGDTLGNNVTAGAALIAKEIKNESVLERDIVLCYPADAPDTLSLRSIAEVVEESGNYYTADTLAKSEEPITKDKIVALCTGYPESKELGQFIKFTKSIKGILLELLLPCVILVIFLIVKIASSKNASEDDEVEYDFYEYENNGGDSRVNSHAKTNSPLFENIQEIQPSDELERKKMSIVENFSQKKVNPDSPYQKEKERTMQFKAQRSAESSFAARNVGGTSSTAPTADALREEMLRKTAEAERTGTFSIKSAGSKQPAESVSDITGILPKAQLAEMARNDIPKTTPLRSQSAQPQANKAPKKSSSPDISDIIKRTDSSARKKSAADMSVDDLLKLIEDEKKKF
ncbi:MAG: hypothetical protein IJY19_11370 [Ruminococcus sp.]|nr:hypothetical protein [Ruminococcus sp.]